MEDVSGYRLIWFQHLHKAAGTLIVNMAKANNEVLHNPHNNGNPSDIKGTTLPLWEYDESRLLDFINNCEEEGVTFVASEFGAPNFKILSSDPRVKLMTCFRDPCKRIISNHNYDYYSGYTENHELGNFLKKINIFTSDNYYVRIFSRMDGFPDKKLTKEDYTNAIENISKFDILINAESENIGERLEKELNWEKIKVDKHGTFGNKWKMISMIKKFQISKLIKYIRKEKLDSNLVNIKNKYTLDYKFMKELFDY